MQTQDSVTQFMFERRLDRATVNLGWASLHSLYMSGSSFRFRACANQHKPISVVLIMLFTCWLYFSHSRCYKLCLHMR